MIEVIHPGLLATVQDLGRYGYQQQGMSVTGAMDPFALRVGNILVGNAPHLAGLEITIMGPTLRAETDLLIAVTSNDLGATIDQEPVPLWKSWRWCKGSVLHFTGGNSGVRAYLCVAGGIDVPLVMGSRSTYLMMGIGGYEGRALQKGDRLPVGKSGMASSKRIRSFSAIHLPPYSQQPTIRVILGPHQDAFTDEGVRTFLSTPYEVTPQSNRMGLRLKGEPIAHRVKADVLSCATTFGTIQVPADGQPIILMADRQTTGGYAQIATVVSVDLPLLAHLLPGAMVRFQAVSVEEGQELVVEQRRLLKVLQ